MLVSYIIPDTGGYELINGELMQCHPTVNKANRLLTQVIGNDVANPTYGNPLITTKNITINDIASGINYALSPLTSTGEISNLQINEIRRTIRGRWNVTLTITLAGESDPLPLVWTQGSK